MHEALQNLKLAAEIDINEQDIIPDLYKFLNVRSTLRERVNASPAPDGSEVRKRQQQQSSALDIYSSSSELFPGLIEAQRYDTVSPADFISLTTENLRHLNMVCRLSIDSVPSARSDINETLLSRLRVTFLDLVRSHYWKQIEEGTLSRNSISAVTLLYSVDVGIDFASIPGHQDWSVLLPTLQVVPRERLISCAKPIDYIYSLFCGTANFLFGWSLAPLHLTDNLREAIEWYQDEYRVTVLTSFIAAHKYAQHKAPQYLGETDLADTPEEKIIVEESAASVVEAADILALIEKGVIQHHVIKQVGFCVNYNDN